MPPRGIQASFWRGGTSRGLIFRAEALAPFRQPVRDQIIRTALGSPDKAGRQISGLGGGVSSLSKAMIIGTPGEGLEDQRVHGNMPGPDWADDGRRPGLGSWDIVYRFVQVGVRDTTLDWEATCGNMLAAVALHALTTPIVPYTTLFQRARSLPRPEKGQPLIFPLSILSASNNTILRARVPIDPISLLPWEPLEGHGITIAGVPEEGAGIELETPLNDGEAAESSSGLVSGRPLDVVDLDGGQIKVSVVTAGLPNIFVHIDSLNVDGALLTASASALTGETALLDKIERLRIRTAELCNIPLSLASPKVTVVGPVPESGYTTSTNAQVSSSEADFVARAVSSGDWHRTIPGTTLAAANIAAGIPGTLVHELIEHTSRPAGGESSQVQDVTVRAAHEAGVTESTVRFVGGKPDSVIMMRTAREIMRGEVMVPEAVFAEHV